ncbi:MAG: T9SS type A sorting domain-containing protein [Bacteroidales bacterium]|nr:T9SS type A sorting domain-containing protein [Bacteroidales bacterium]
MKYLLLIIIFCFGINVKSQLIANFSVDNPLCAGSNISFSDISFGPNQILSRQWYIDDVLYGTDSVFSWFVPVGTSVAAVKLIVDDGFGPSSKESILSFYNLPDITIDVSNYNLSSCVVMEPNYFYSCPSQEVSFSADGGETYNWYKNESLFSNLPNLEISSISETTDLYILEGTDHHGCVNYDTVYIVGLPIYSLSEHIDICEGDSVLIIHPVENFYVSISDTIEVNYLSECLCDSTMTFFIGVHPKIYVYESQDICNGDSILWEGNWYNSSGNYQVLLSSVFGCDSIRQLDLTVNAAYNNHEEISICNGETIMWQSLEYFESGFYENSFTDSYGCDSVYTLNLTVNPVFTQNTNALICNGETYNWNGEYYSTAGIYEVIYTNSLGCDSILSLVLEVNPTPAPFLGNDTLICYYNSLELCAGSYESYNWINGQNSDCIEIIGDSTGTGIFMYWVEVENEYSCSNSDTIIITVDWCVGLEEINKEFKVFPNPVKDFLVVEIEEPNEFTYSLSSLYGIIFMEGKSQLGITKINLTGIVPGIYFLEIRNNQKNLKEKIIKQ